MGGAFAREIQGETVGKLSANALDPFDIRARARYDKK